jgi:hypothetical protein
VKRWLALVLAACGPVPAAPAAVSTTEAAPSSHAEAPAPDGPADFEDAAERAIADGVLDVGAHLLERAAELEPTTTRRAAADAARAACDEPGEAALDAALFRAAHDALARGRHRDAADLLADAHHPRLLALAGDALWAAGERREARVRWSRARVALAKKGLAVALEPNEVMSIGDPFYVGEALVTPIAMTPDDAGQYHDQPWLDVRAGLGAPTVRWPTTSIEAGAVAGFAAVFDSERIVLFDPFAEANPVTSWRHTRAGTWQVPLHAHAAEHIAVTDEDRRHVAVWSAATRKVFDADVGAETIAIALSTDGARLAVATVAPASLRVYELPGGKRSDFSLPGQLDLGDVGFDGDHLVALDQLHGLHRWSSTSGARVLDADGRCTQPDETAHTECPSLPCECVRRSHLSADGRHAIDEIDAGVRVRETTRGETIGLQRGAWGAVVRDGAIIAVDPKGYGDTAAPFVDGRIELSADAHTALVGIDDAVVAWDLAAGRERARLPARGRDIQLLGDGDNALVVDGGRVIVWSIVSGRQRTLGYPEAVTAVAASADGELVAVAAGPTVFLEAIASGKRVRLDDHALPVHALAISADGRRIASAADEVVWIRDEAGAHLATLELRFRDAQLALSRDGRRLGVASSGSQEVQVWRVATARRSYRAPRDGRGAKLFGFTADGRALIAGRNRSIVRYDLPGGRGVEIGHGDPTSRGRVRYHDQGALSLIDSRVQLFDAAAVSRLARVVSLAHGGWLALSDGGAADAGDEVARRGALTRVDGVFYGWGLGWDWTATEHLVERAAAGELVLAPGER